MLFHGRHVRLLLCSLHILLLLVGLEAGHDNQGMCRLPAIQCRHSISSYAKLHCRCFQNARMLSKAGGHLTLLQLLPTADEQAVPGLIADICMAIKKLAVNDDICKELADAGALDITLPVCVLLQQLAKRQHRGCALQLASLNASPAVAFVRFALFLPLRRRVLYSPSPLLGRTRTH